MLSYTYKSSSNTFTTNYQLFEKGKGRLWFEMKNVFLQILWQILFKNILFYWAIVYFEKQDEFKYVLL